jgi:acetyl-CoA carboxylase biotin carboxyl carrier protein
MSEERGEQIEQATETSDGQSYSGLTDAVRELVDVMHKGDLERIEVSHGDLHILLCARTAPAVIPAAPATQNPGDAAPTTPAPVAASEPAAQPWHQITSPMVGTYYEAPSPGEPPFVRPGDYVEVGQTVAIIEAMKIMNEIVADRAGLIDEVLVENGEAVEFGHPLFSLRPA